LNRVEASTNPVTTPTAILSAIVLPSGHTSPDAPGGAHPNYSEIPENLRAAVQTMAEMPVPTAGPESAQHLRIPRIAVDQDIVQGDGWEQLKKGIGMHIGSVNPGQKETSSFRRTMIFMGKPSAALMNSSPVMRSTFAQTSGNIPML